MATTPPPPSSLREPPTPKHGAGYHAYEPYPTRHSARLASQRSRDAHTTPPPAPPKKGTHPQPSTNLHTLSPPGSGAVSPRKKSTRGTVAANDNLGLDSADLSDGQGTSTQKQSLHPTSFLTSMANAGALPTPVKTPRKKVDESASTARVLFPTSSTERSKKAKKYSGFSLDSFHEGASENQDKIAIFTDSRDRVPVIDDSDGNPFRKQSESEAPAMDPKTSHSYKRRKLAPSNEASADEAPAEAVKRDDGMLYVFRGKKIFRKFQDTGMEEEIEEDDDLGLFADRPDLLDDSVDLHARPMTRSSIKPRVLFPSIPKQTAADRRSPPTDEEAPTDIEEHPEAIEGDDVTHSADVDMDAVSSSGRSLRSRAAKVPEIQDGIPTGVAPKKEKARHSPFAVWMRKKQSPVDTGLLASKKRDADPTANLTAPVAKKTRGK